MLRVRPLFGFGTSRSAGSGLDDAKLSKPQGQGIRESYQLQNSVVTRRIGGTRKVHMGKISLAVVDDHQVVIDGLLTMLSGYPELDVVYATTAPQDFLRYIETAQIDVALLDINMPELDGLELCRQILALRREVKVIAFSSFDDTHYVKQILRKGAMGYLLKNASRQTLVDAIRSVHDGREYIDETIQKAIVRESVTGQRRSMFEIPLTKREKEVLKLIAEEHTNQEIADKLFLSLRTIETHRANLSQKLGAKNTASLVKEAIRRGLTT